MLSANGYTVDEAVNGKIAVEMVSEGAYDLILMDIAMPVMDGRTATRAIRALSSPAAKTPIIALTANAMPEERKAFLSDGMNHILTKPLSRDAMYSVLAKYIGECRKANTPSVQLKPVDTRHIAELAETLGHSALQSILQRFILDVEETMPFLSLAHPMETIAHHAHKIAGSAATLGATKLRAILLKVENAAKEESVAPLTEELDKLPEIWAETKNSLLSTNGQS
ncbi:UNVERIFIED_CONTAM: hypothetical protein GTU68_054713 [Idotea baltica]|nr:hypothetical protein [Idotea baltica]